MPNRKEITLKQIEDENGTPGRASIFMKNYNKWSDLVIKDTDSLGLIDLEVRIKQKVYNKIGTSMLSIFYMLAYIFSEMNLIILSGISLILATYGLILKSLSQNQKRTRKGIEDYAKWKAFKKFLLHFSNIESYDESSLVLWEQYLIYATSLGIAYKVFSKFNFNFYTNNTNLNTKKLNNSNNSWLYNNAYKYSFFDRSILQSINKVQNLAFRNSNSSYSSGRGFGGGFSGGSSGRGGYSGGGGGRPSW